MYKVVEYNGFNTIIHSNEFEPNTMKLLFIGSYSDCYNYKKSI